MNSVIKVSCRKAFTDVMLERGRQNKDILAVATDSAGSVTLGGFIKELPDQYVEMGIAEQNAVSFAAGLSTTGKRVFVCGPACFLSARAFEQVKVDIAYNKSSVVVFGVSSGVSYGPLGGTHTSLHDIASMRALPNLHIYAPSDAVQTRFIAECLCKSSEPAYVRVGRGDVPAVYTEGEAFDIGKAKTVRDGNDGTIIAYGESVYYALKASELLEAEGINVRVIDMFRIKPCDEEAVIKSARETGAILTVEEHSMFGGLGELVSHITAENCPVPMSVIGFDDNEVPVGNSADLFKYCGITAENIKNRFIKLMERK